MKSLFIPLKREYYEKFESGEKWVELRPYGKRWNEHTCFEGRPVVLSLGYGKKHRLTGVVVSFFTSAHATFREDWQKIYGNKYDRAACIEIGYLKPVTEKILMSKLEEEKGSEE